MTKSNYTAHIANLKAITTIPAIMEVLHEADKSGDNGTATCNAHNWVLMSNLPEAIKEITKLALIEGANDVDGFYRNGNGIKHSLEVLAAVINESAANDAQYTNKPVNSFNLRNLQNLVSDGAIFYVEFIKRSTGALRKMKCRTGVRKHLKGGSKGYSAKAKGLLTVFDMEAKGYRSIPVDAIERLTIGGQSFDFAGV